MDGSEGGVVMSRGREGGGRGGGGGLPPPVFFPGKVGGGPAMLDWQAATIQPVPIGQLGESYHRHRLTDADAESDMDHSLQRNGELSPVTVCRRHDTLEVVDGFKRLAAAHQLGWARLSARLLTADEPTVKAPVSGLRLTGHQPQAS